VMIQMLNVKRLYKISELQEIGALEQVVWGRQMLSAPLAYTVANNGGIVLGAYMQEKMIGFLFSFPGVKDGQAYLCSHLLGVDPSYRNSGLGRRLKEVQREYAIQEGY